MAASEIAQEVNLNELEPILEGFKEERWALIPLLQKVQEQYGYIPPEAIEPIAQSLRLFPSEVQGVVTFYSQFYTTPRGKNIIRVCRGTACHVRGSGSVLKILKQNLGIEPGETTPDLNFTLETVACLGACFLAPTMMVNS
jgi:NADH:ubiquinone oxidoreductase subunit E